VISQFCDWLAATRVSQIFQELSWFVPLIQSVHILSIAVVMTAAGALDCKLLGIAGRAWSLDALVSHYMPWIWSALLILLVTGTLLTITEPSRELTNVAFRAKMIMVIAVASILWIVQQCVRRDPLYWTQSPQRRKTARALGGASLLLAVAIVVAGRWIAYL